MFDECRKWSEQRTQEERPRARQLVVDASGLTKMKSAVEVQSAEVDKCGVWLLEVWGCVAYQVQPFSLVS